MSNCVYERDLDGKTVTEDEIWTYLISRGFADDRGMLNNHAISKLGGMEIPLNTCSDVEKEDVSAVIGTDTRVRVSDTAVAPYKSIVLLIMKYGDAWYRGTGFMVKDNVVLTAAHNLYSQEKECPADKVFIVAESKDKAHVRCGGKLSVPLEYVGKASDDGHYDWGLIKLNEPMSDIGVINVAEAADVSAEALRDGLIAGYPGVVKGAETCDMWQAEGLIDSYYSSSQTLDYKISTSSGNSGSPVMVIYKGRRTAVGIHVMGSVAVNTAKAIDDEVTFSINAFH